MNEKDLPERMIALADSIGAGSKHILRMGANELSNACDKFFSGHTRDACRTVYGGICKGQKDIRYIFGKGLA